MRLKDCNRTGIFDELLFGIKEKRSEKYVFILRVKLFQ